jgi:hypothetical protein
MPIKSYIEPKDLPTDGFSNLSSALKVIQYGDIDHESKPDVIVVKESFFLRNKDGTKIGVFTRSSKDHKATLGDCRVLLNNDFMREEATVDNFGRVSYDVSDRLHEHLGSYSSLFRPAKTNDSVLVHFKNPNNGRRYLFAVFEMICVDFPPPLYLRLKTRIEDAFVGVHDIEDVAAGIEKYNQSTIDIDKNLIRLVKPKRFFQNANSSIFRAEIKNSLVSPNLTLLKVNLIGIG